MLLDPNSVRRASSSREAALFISGQRMAEGSLREMKLKFDSEIAGHSAPTEVRLYGADGSYKVKWARK
jgi:hypothetical protein